MKKQFALLVANNGGVDVIIELFHANAPRTESYAARHLNSQPGYATDGIPLLSAEGILKAAVPDVKGLNYWLNNRMYGTDNSGLIEWNIQTAAGYNYDYRALLNYLKGKTIQISKVKLQGDINAIRNNWTVRRYALNGSTDEQPINLTNTVMPNQVNTNILEFDLNQAIDGDTACEVVVKAGTSYSILFDFEEK